MKFQEDFELREKVFRKMGAVWGPNRNKNTVPKVYYWQYLDAEPVGGWPANSFDKSMIAIPEKLPATETSWEVCAEYLVPFMRNNGFDYRILNYPDILGLGFFWVGHVELAQDRQWVKSPITNNNIAHAACEAFLEVKLNADK